MTLRMTPVWGLFCLAGIALAASMVEGRLWNLRRPVLEPGKAVFVSLGRQPSGTLIERETGLLNPLPRELQVASFQVSCGCTAVKIPAKTIAPGERSTLGIRIDTKDRFGPNRFFVTTTFVDAPPAQVIMTVDLYKPE